MCGRDSSFCRANAYWRRAFHSLFVAIERTSFIYEQMEFRCCWPGEGLSLIILLGGQKASLLLALHRNLVGAHPSQSSGYIQCTTRLGKWESCAPGGRLSRGKFNMTIPNPPFDVSWAVSGPGSTYVHLWTHSCSAQHVFSACQQQHTTSLYPFSHPPLSLLISLKTLGLGNVLYFNTWFKGTWQYHAGKCQVSNVME